MGAKLVALDSSDQASSGDVLRLLSERLARVATAGNAVLQLPEQAGAGVGLLDWLCEWQQAFKVAGHRMVIVASTAEQYESLEYSHPDWELEYVRSIEESPIVPGEDTPPPVVSQQQAVPVPTPEPPVSEKLPLQQLAPEVKLTVADTQRLNVPDIRDSADAPQHVEPQAAAAGPVAAVSQPVAPETEPEEEKLEYSPECGEVAAISGEYECRSCKLTRMWLKGDKIGLCENQECSATQAGWQLTFELF